jgi:hypothetical protein
MTPNYPQLAQRIRHELLNISKVVNHAQEAFQLADEQPHQALFFMAAVAFDLHSFYTGVERLLELIAKELDHNLPQGAKWHRALLDQMVNEMSGIRPAVFSSESHHALRKYLAFRHVVRNLYVFDLRDNDVAQLAISLPKTFILVQNDLLTFATFLETLD